MESRVVDNSQIRNTAQRKPHPSLASVSSKGTEQARGQHDQIGRDGRNEIRAWQAGEQGDIHQQEGRG